MKSDGNGGVIIGKGVLALIMVVIALLSIVGTVMAYTVTIRADVDNLQDYFAESGPRHIETINDINDHIAKNQDTIILNQERILSMKEDINEIKLDVKEIVNR